MKTKLILCGLFGVAFAALCGITNKPALIGLHQSARVQAAAQTPTFNKEVARIFQTSCQNCHSPGEVAPFSLLTYKEARPWARAIREAVIKREMPPWKPQAGCGDFQNSTALTQADINTIAAWVDAGAPEGNAADLPAPRTFPETWPQGEPDLIVTPEEDFTPPQGKDAYRCFSIPVSQLRGSRFLQGVDVQPGNRKIVHHVLAFSDATGQSAALDAQDAGPGYSCFGGPGFELDDDSNILGAWAPGASGEFVPAGTGIKLSVTPQARVVIQVHYHPTGEVESDRTSVGFYFARQPVKQEAYLLGLENDSFLIPAGATNYVVTQQAQLPPGLSLKLLNILPHMHLLGRQIKVEYTLPNSSAPNCLINIPDWDFDWQSAYSYKTPVSIPSGSQVKLTAVYDNSANNPRNPNSPPKPVGYGEETTDEMALAFLRATVDGDSVKPSTPSVFDVIADAAGNLAAGGAGWLPGADLLVNGRRVRDTRLMNGQLISPAVWKAFAAPGQAVNVAIINPDGYVSNERSFTRNVTARPLAVVSAAGYQPDFSTPGSIAAAFGEGLAISTLAANATPLPTTLGGTRIFVNGVAAQLFFVSPRQINFQFPTETFAGTAVVEVELNGQLQARGTLMLGRIRPAIFTANGSGTGAPAAVATRDGINYYAVGNPNGQPNPVNAGDVLVLFGTGFQQGNRETAKVTIGGRAAEVLYAGRQGQFIGADQLNIQIPPGLSGLVDANVEFNGRAANPVKLLVR